MPHVEGIPGVVPEGQDPDAYDRLRRRVLWSMPYGLYVVGATHDGAANAMTLNLATQVATDPKLLGISVLKEALTNSLIRSSQIFALCIIGREDNVMARKFSKPAAHDSDARTLNGFSYTTRTTGAPILSDAVAYLDCRVQQAVEAGDHDFFIGEVVDAGFLKDEETPILRMEDTRMNYGG